MNTPTTPITRFNRNSETTYTPPEDAAAFCDNWVRRPYGKTFEPACTTGRGNWRECGDCPAKPGRPAVVVVAPQGAGKSRYAEQLAKRFGCSVIADGWEGDDLVPPGTLALTNTPQEERPIIGQLEASAIDQQAIKSLAGVVGE